MKFLKFINFMLGIVVGYCVLSFWLQYKIVVELCTKIQIEKKIFHCNTISNSQEDKSLLLLNFKIKSTNEESVLKEIYDTSSVINYISNDIYVQPWKPEDKLINNVFQILSNIQNKHLTNSFRYFGLVNKPTYIQVEKLTRYLENLKHLQNTTMILYFSTIPVKKQKMKLENLLSESFVLINRNLVQQMLRLSATKCAANMLSETFKCLNNEIDIDRISSDTLLDFMGVSCQKPLGSLTLKWKFWCTKAMISNPHVVQHLMERNANIMRLENRLLMLHDEKEEIENIIEDSIDVNSAPEFDDRIIWKSFSQRMMFHIVSVLNPEANLNNMLKSSVALFTSAIIKNKISFVEGRRHNKMQKMSGYFRSVTNHAEEYIMQIENTLQSFYVKIPFASTVIREVSSTEKGSIKIKNITISTITERDSGSGFFETTQFSLGEEDLPDRIVFVVPFSSRPETLKRFIADLLLLNKESNENFHLILVAFENPEYKLKTSKIILQFFKNNSTFPITLIQKNAYFQRGPACQLGASKAKPSDLMLFVDVDMKLNSETLDRIRWTTKKGSQVYYPMVYSRLKYHNNWEQTLNFFEISEYTGYWRTYGFGMLAIYKSDFNKLPGYSKKIKGWGEEDVDLANKMTESKSFSIFRAPDPSFIHIHHEKLCDLKELAKKFDSCVAVKYLHMASHLTLNSYIQTHEGVLKNKILSPRKQRKTLIRRQVHDLMKKRSNKSHFSLRREKENAHANMRKIL